MIHRTTGHPDGSPYRCLPKNEANHAPLTPLAFLLRTKDVFGGLTAIVDGERRFTYADLHARSMALAGALEGAGVAPGDTVAVLAPNMHALIEAHYGVPMAGAVLNALNTRLDPESLAYIMDHGRTKLLLCDAELAPLAAEALTLMDAPPPVIGIEAPGVGLPEGFAGMDYETFLDGADPAFVPYLPADEWQAIALNYTSGTTGRPKGVVYHHRGAHLNAVGNALVWGMDHHPVYLWTLPMFHCNGWCFPWTITLMAGTHVCLRKVTGAAVFAAIAAERVTHLCGAPVVMGMMLNTPEAERAPFDHPVRMMTAAAAPPAAVLEKMAALGVEVTHVYGLTEVYGPATVCAPQPDWAGLDAAERAALLARQGVRYPVLEGLDVLSAEDQTPVPADGTTMGEIVMRGHDVMMGYLDDPDATARAFAGGWFHTGDLAVKHPDGYVEIKDRSKDIIISGGENVSSIEVEGVLYRHPDVAEAAVVAMADPTWGEVPCAFVTPREGATPDEAGVIAFCRERLAGFKTPKRVVFGPLPKTSTGKIQKFELRRRVGE